MDIFLAMIIETLLAVLCIWPGAIIRWLLSRLWNSKRTLKEFKSDSSYLNGSIGLLSVVAIVVLIIKLLQ